MGVLQHRNQDDDDESGLGIVGMEPLDEDPDASDVVFDLDDWSDDDLAALRQRIDEVGMPHTWEGASLVVAPADEGWAELLIEQVEEQLSLALDDTAEQVAYDLSEWDEASRTALLEAIAAEAIPHGWDGTELFVQELDEQRVDELVDAVVDPDAAVTADGGHELLSDLFVAADRLRHDAGDRAGTDSLLEAADRAAAGVAPYGVDAKAWGAVQDATAELAGLLRDADADDEAIVGAADRLRSLLRSYV
jgi:hypothetical protein